MMSLVYLWAVIGSVILIGYFYLRWQAKKIAKQKQEIEKVKAEARAIAEELDNADKRKQIEQANQRLNANGIDDQLQSRDWLRD